MNIYLIEISLQVNWLIWPIKVIKAICDWLQLYYEHNNFSKLFKTEYVEVQFSVTAKMLVYLDIYLLDILLKRWF